VTPDCLSCLLWRRFLPRGSRGGHVGPGGHQAAATLGASLVLPCGRRVRLVRHPGRRAPVLVVAGGRVARGGGVPV